MINRSDDDHPVSRGDLRRLGLDVAPQLGPPLPPNAQAVALDSWQQISERAAAATAPGYPVAPPIAAGTRVSFRAEAIRPPGPERRIVGQTTTLRVKIFDGTEASMEDLAGVKISPFVGEQIAKAATPPATGTLPFPGSPGSATAGGPSIG